MPAIRPTYNIAPYPNGTAASPSVEELLQKAEDQLAAAVYTIGLLSHKLRGGQVNGTHTPAPLPRRAAPAPAPVQEQPARRTRRSGAADRITSAVLSRAGVLVTEAHNIAGFTVSPAYLDRLAGTRNFRWWMTGEGDKRRYIGNRKVT